MKKLAAAVMSLASIFSVAAGIDVNLKDINGKEVKLSQFRGKPTYIKMWASWCPICLATLPHTQQLVREKNKDFNVITVVSPGHINEQTTKEFLKWWKSLSQYGDIPVYLDESGELIRKAGVRAYPTNVFLNKNGEIKFSAPGPISSEIIKKHIKERAK
ncbi:redoxin family protein [Caviibacter abscessus]|uniref:redoxin family protein n=1 Tax=Caviibacter abscessus TaxID=1766719 RepID=UPI00082DCD34|nr:redoxin family protein [Caviibacter abscessus]